MVSLAGGDQHVHARLLFVVPDPMGAGEARLPHVQGEAFIYVVWLLEQLGERWCLLELLHCQMFGLLRDCTLDA